MKYFMLVSQEGHIDVCLLQKNKRGANLVGADLVGADQTWTIMPDGAKHA